MKTINKELEKIGGALIPQPDTALTNYQDALSYKIKILFFARNYFAQGELQDIGHHFWFEDKEGIRYTDKEIRGWPKDRLDAALKSKSLSIRHEPVNTTPLLIDRIIEELGYRHILGDEINKQLEAYKQLRRHGLPHYHGQSCRWYTVEEAKKDIAKLELNEVSDAEIAALENVLPGLWAEKMQGHHDQAAALEEYKEYIHEIEGGALSQNLMPYVGINPRDGYPVRHSEFTVSEKQEIMDVPDRYLESPSIDKLSGRPVWVLPLSKTFQRAVEEGGVSVIFRAAESRRLYHLPTARTIDVPPKGGTYKEFYNHIAKVYSASGHEQGDAPRMAIIGNGPHPIHGLREFNARAQTLHIEKEIFEGLISPRLGGFDVRPSGVIFRDDNLKIQSGAIRLQECKNGVSTGWEIETDIESVQSIALEDLLQFSDEDLSRYGFRTKDEEIDFFCALFGKQKKDPRQNKNKAWAIAFGDVLPDDPKRGVMYHKPDERIYSRLSP